MSIMGVMERDERKRPRARRSFTAELKAEIVELCQVVTARPGGSARTSI
jgi:transposase-like protein